MIINYAYTSQVLPKALLLDPIRFLDYYEIGSPYIDCPAIQDFYKNTFIVPFPIDFYCKIKIHDEQIYFEESNLDIEIAKVFCQLQGNLNKDMSLDMQFKPLEITYWSDDTCVTEAWGSNINNLVNMGGCYDIRKWIRPNHTAYIIPKKISEFTVSFKKNSPWLFFKCNVNQRIKLKYNYDAALIKESLKMADSTHFVSGLKKYFKKFGEIRPRKLTK